MITIQGIYDGVKIVPTQRIPQGRASKVEITFFEEVLTTVEEQMHHFANHSIFDFWGNERDESESNNINEK